MIKNERNLKIYYLLIKSVFVLSSIASLNFSSKIIKMILFIILIILDIIFLIVMIKKDALILILVTNVLPFSLLITSFF